MPTRTINLTDRYDDFVEGLIASGRYKNVSEVMRAGLRLLEQQAKEDEAKLSLLRKLADESFGALDRGAGIALNQDKELADFISKIGRRAAKRVKDRPMRRITDAPAPASSAGRTRHRGDPRMDARVVRRE